MLIKAGRIWLTTWKTCSRISEKNIKLFLVKYLPFSSRFHSSSYPHRTSTFQRIRRSSQQLRPLASFMAAYCCPLHWEWKTVDLDPFPLCPAFSGSLDGCDSVEYYGSAVP